MSLFVRSIWRRITNPTRFVGRDLDWNKYYEYPSSSSDPRRTKRTVQYRQAEDMWHYIGGGRRLPVQWSAWLTHTRPEPPTLGELQADLARQQRVLSNAALIEARDRAQTLRLTEITQLENTPEHPSPQVELKAADTHGSDQPEASSSTEKIEKAEPPPLASEPLYEPQSWTPQSRPRHDAKLD